MTGDFETMLDQRARELAPALAPREAVPPVLVCSGRAGRWALPVAAVSWVERLTAWTPVPGRPGILGLAMVARRRVLLADLDVLAAGSGPRDADRPGHAVLLRQAEVAVAVDRAGSVSALDFTARVGAGAGVAAAADGTVLLDPGFLLAAMGWREGR